MLGPAPILASATALAVRQIDVRLSSLEHHSVTNSCGVLPACMYWDIRSAHSW